MKLWVWRFLYILGVVFGYWFASVAFVAESGVYVECDGEIGLFERWPCSSPFVFLIPGVLISVICLVSLFLSVFRRWKV